MIATARPIPWPLSVLIGLLGGPLIVYLGIHEVRHREDRTFAGSERRQPAWISTVEGTLTTAFGGLVTVLTLWHLTSGLK